MRTPESTDDFHADAVLTELAQCQQPFLIGVRHHSAAMAKVIPELLDQFSPDIVLLELPPEFSQWIPWLAHPETQGPIALSGCDSAGQNLSFYPFAEFSPELAAIRWANQNNIPVEAFDLPISERHQTRRTRSEHTAAPRGLLQRLLKRTESTDSGQLWERLVESTSAGCAAESIRRSGLLFGWATRWNDHEPSDYDLTREAWMRTRIAAHRDKKSAAVIGAYHAAALLPTPRLWNDPAERANPTERVEPAGHVEPASHLEPGRSSTPDKRKATRREGSNDLYVTAMIPYSFSQLDERSGYPAGIRDPLWHQKSFEATTLEQCDDAVADIIVSVCRELRRAGHPMNAADGMEVLRMARDLARMRSLAVPGRGELIEALQTCLTRGQLFGLGRAVAEAMQQILVGKSFGVVPTELPRCGLAPHLETILQQLRLPGPDNPGEEKRLRLDPLRSSLDRARVVVFEQLVVCQIPYAKRADDGSVGDRESLTSVWDVHWQHGTQAMIALAGTRGATLRQAAEGTLRSQGMEKPTAEWELAQLQQVIVAANCGFVDLVQKGLKWLLGSFSTTASLAELMQALSFVDRVRSGHIPGLPSASDEFLPAFCEAFVPPEGLSTSTLLQAAISRVSGLAGSDDEADVAALLDLVSWFEQQQNGVETADETGAIASGRLLLHLSQFSDNGSPLMQGAALGCRLVMDDISQAEFQLRTSSWLDNGVDESLRHELLRRLRGVLILVSPQLHSDPTILDGMGERIDVWSDSEFFDRLPALRGGFDVLPPALRRLLLKQIERRIESQTSLSQTSLPQSPHSPVSHVPKSQVSTAMQRLAIDPLIQKLMFEADQVARAAVDELLTGLIWLEDSSGQVPVLSPASFSSLVDNPDKARTPASRNSEAVAVATATIKTSDASPRQLNLLDRWRLILGVRDPAMSPSARRAARALDELYGHGSGEGSRAGLGGGGGAGDEAPFPSTRVWADELGDLFGDRVREEVLGSAVEKGRAAALAVMNEESVRPSVELLQTVLSMKGSLPENQTEKLRRIARRITEELAKELATRIAPALMGLSTPRPTRRPNRRLDLRRTVLANLKTARIDDDGSMKLVPEQFYFRTPARRTTDWHLIFVVDVSGSMEPSVIYSALTAAIFSALPALSVTFLAFSTTVIDFTDHVEDPLAMLMEVQVGGGTFIWKGLAAARERLKIPARTIVLLVTDFEEGGSLGALLGEVQALVDSGAKVLGLAALSDTGQPRYHTGIASEVVNCGMPVAALSPLELARWVGEQIR